MILYFCDLCEKEIPVNQTRYGISIVDIDKDKPAIRALEVCPFCKVKIEESLSKWVKA